MQQYIARRVIQSVGMLVALSILVFLLLRIAPGADPARIRCGLTCTDERYHAMRQEMGLDDSYFSQYMHWAKQISTGSLGRDWNGGTVAHEMRLRIPVTFELMVLAIASTIVIGIPMGVLSALFRNSPIDFGVRFGAALGLAVPSFWIATLVLFVPLKYWGYAPPITKTISFFDSPWDNLRQFGPPALILGAVAAAQIIRLTRSAMLEVMFKDYIRTARAKGLGHRAVVIRHALRNSLIPVATVLGLQVAGELGGAVIIERIFNLQGIGNYTLDALGRKDFMITQTMTMYIAVIVVTMNLVVDLGYAWLDPRIRYS
ncbi:MAG: ABC transporter permease [Chloroflexi bacterium]|nr:ABC transporter permease [Chloroflexota bacterium]